MYLPWLGLFDRIYKTDVFVLLDNVPYSKNYFINRNRIKTAEGEQWLTVPVITKNCFGKPINEVGIDNSQAWQRKHWKNIYYSYNNAEHFSEYSEFFEEFYKKEWELLIDPIEESFGFFLKSLGIETKIVKASELGAEGNKEELLLNICKELGADSYLSGPSGRDYLDKNRWNEKGIHLEFHDYAHPEYQQMHGKFIENLSVLDLLFNCGEKSLKILANQR